MRIDPKPISKSKIYRPSGRPKGKMAKKFKCEWCFKVISTKLQKLVNFVFSY